jgi:hypothetical protein
MVSTAQIEFVSLVRVYVTNRGYPSMHVYTVDEELIAFSRRIYNARTVVHVGTIDIVISKRSDIMTAARHLLQYGPKEKRPIAVTLIRYCTCDTPQARKRVANRLARQLKKQAT